MIARLKASVPQSLQARKYVRPVSRNAVKHVAALITFSSLWRICHFYVTKLRTPPCWMRT